VAVHRADLFLGGEAEVIVLPALLRHDHPHEVQLLLAAGFHAIEQIDRVFIPQHLCLREVLILFPVPRNQPIADLESGFLLPFL